MKQGNYMPRNGHLNGSHARGRKEYFWTLKLLGSISVKTDLSLIFYFLSRRILFTDFVPVFFHFVREKVPGEILKGISGKILQSLYHKIPRHISAGDRAKR